MLRLDMHMIAGVLQYVAVASFAEAWIEKSSYEGSPVPITTSPPSRRRGLKKDLHKKSHRTSYVASFAEAWIEKVSYNHNFLYTRSPPSRRRGLKIH